MKIQKDYFFQKQNKKEYRLIDFIETNQLGFVRGSAIFLICNGSRDLSKLQLAINWLKTFLKLDHKKEEHVLSIRNKGAVSIMQLADDYELTINQGNALRCICQSVLYNEKDREDEIEKAISWLEKDLNELEDDLILSTAAHRKETNNKIFSGKHAR